MIQVQAFREAERQPNQIPEEYVEESKDKEEKRSRGPVVIFLAILAIVAYLKSFLTILPAEAAKAEPGKGDPDEAVELPPAAEVAARAIDGEEVASSEGVKNLDREEDAAGEPTPSNVIIFTSSYVPGFIASEQPPLEFSRMGSMVESGRPVGASTAPFGDFLKEAGSAPALGSSGSNSAGSSPGFGGGSDPTGPGSNGGGSGGGGNTPGGDPPPTDGGGHNNPPQNRAPRHNGAIRLHDLVGFHAVIISYAVLLAGASDPDGDTLSIVGLTASRGTLTPVEGGWLYEGGDGLLGEVHFNYLISDGRLTIAQQANLNVLPVPPIVGTPYDDNLLGTPYNDEINGGKGDDNIVALAGDDVIDGGGGDDHIVAGSGNDIIFAGCGNDLVFAGDGDDIVFGGKGDDRIFGEEGNDILYGEEGCDLLAGGNGADTLIGGAGDDELQGDAGHDVLRGDSGDDVLHGGLGDDKLFGGTGTDKLKGGDGDDFLDGGTGSDVVSGGDGNDHVLASLDAANDDYFGGADHDTLDYSLAARSLVIDLEVGTVEGDEVGVDNIDSFESIFAGAADDFIHFGEHFVEVAGGGGNNTFSFDLPDGGRRSDEVVARITDFKVGDKLYVADFEIKYRDGDDFFEELEDAFEKVYNSQNDDHRKVKFKFDKMDEQDITVVEVQDINGDGIEDSYSIVIDGRHSIGVTVSVVTGS